jgi:hypothetical protein
MLYPDHTIVKGCAGSEANTAPADWLNIPVSVQNY